MMETNLGIFNREKKFSTGERIKDRKTAKEKGKRTGFASFMTTPTIMMAMITREIVMTLFSFITAHYKSSKRQ